MIHALELGFGAFGGLLAFSLFWEILKGATPLITAAIVVYIAWQQWRLARQRVKLDLFQKRLPLYHAAQALAAFIAANARVTEDELRKFNLATRDAPFIFERRIAFYFQEMQAKAAELWALSAEISELSADQKTAEAGKTVQWFAEQSSQITRRFVPVLGLYNL